MKNESNPRKINSPPHNLCQYFTYNKILSKQITDKTIKLSDAINRLFAWLSGCLKLLLFKGRYPVILSNMKKTFIYCVINLTNAHISCLRSLSGNVPLQKLIFNYIILSLRYN